jgi:hypothetical protein
VTVIFDGNFTAIPDAPTWPAEYWRPRYATTGTATVAGGYGVLTVPDSTGSITIESWPKRVDNFELYAAMRLPDATSNPLIVFRSSEDWVTGPLTANCYFLSVTNATVGLCRRYNGATVGLTTITRAVPTDTLTAVRIQVVGARIRVKFWTPPEVEPIGWQIDATDSLLPRRGRITLTLSGKSSTGSIARIQRFTLTDIGDAYTPHLTGAGQAKVNGTGAVTVFTFAHGLDATPAAATVTPVSAAAAGPFYVTSDATNVTVTYLTAPPAGAGNVVLNWRAEA